MPSKHSLWQHFQKGITLCCVPTSLPYMQISPPWNHSLIMEIKPEHIYLPARLRRSSRLNICFPGCHRCLPGAVCHLFGFRAESDCKGSGSGGSCFASYFSFSSKCGGTLARSLSSHKLETSQWQKKWLMSGWLRKLLRVFTGESQLLK